MITAPGSTMDVSPQPTREPDEPVAQRHREVAQVRTRRALTWPACLENIGTGSITARQTYLT
jgi:hypothetical protein